MNSFGQDIVYGVRMLVKNPALSLIAALSLALGIGLNTAIFTLVNTILLGSLPYAEPDRIVSIATVPPQHHDQTDVVSIPDFFAWKERSRSFETMGAVVNNARYFGAESNGVPAERIIGEDVTPETLPALGVKPWMGRLIAPSEDEVDNPAPVLLISYRLWQSRFGGDPNILSRTTLINGVPTNIIGVMAPDFRLTDDRSDYWGPLRINHFQLRGSARYITVLGRLKRGVSIPQAQSDMDAVAAHLAQEAPARDTEHGKPWGVRIQTIREALFGFMSRPLLLLQGAVGFVLLIACANVAALLLARASSRRNEVAIRCALGAGRWRIFRQFLTESVLLSLAGGACGILLAAWGVRTLVGLAPPFFPRLHDTVMDSRVLWFSAILSLLTGVVFGVGPAMQGAKAGLIAGFKDAVRGGTAGVVRTRLRSGLVMVQLAMALVLLIGAGLLIRSFMRIQAVHLGCDPKGLLTFAIRMPPNQFTKPTGMYENTPLWEVNPIAADNLSRIFERTRNVPGVVSAAGVVTPPLVGALTVNFTVEGHPAADTNALSAEYFPVTPNFFATMKIPLLRGRDFNDRDTVSGPWVAIVNETMAHRFWPNEDPIGKRIRIDLAPDEQPREVIAVTHDTPSSRLQNHQEPAIYVHFAQVPPHILGPYSGIRTQLTFVYRTAGEPLSMTPALRRAVAEIDPNRPLVEIKTVEQYMAQEIQYPRYYSMLLGLFAVVATILAAVGIYGVMAYAVAQRTREIGIRMALGANGRDVWKLVIIRALAIIAAGLALGLGSAFALTRFLSSELWEVTATDPTTFAVVSMVLAAVAVAACLIPTRRAVRVDPTIALRYE